MSRIFGSNAWCFLRTYLTEGILITKRGRPVARLLPVSENDGYLIRSLAGQLKIKGDVFSTGDQWNADSGFRRTN